MKRALAAVVVLGAALTATPAMAGPGPDVWVDTDPIEESTNCAYGPAIDTGGFEVTWEEHGLYVRKDSYNSGPLWTIPC